MTLSRRRFVAGGLAFAALPQFVRAASPYEGDGERAADSVLCRRLYLDLAGRIPTPEEARAFAASGDAGKFPALVDSLLLSEDFTDYWTMRFADVLRVKSEFPVNLWPNAVYVYWRRIRAFVEGDEGWDHFAAALLNGKGSDFRDAEANFYRAVARRTPEGYSEAASLAFLGEETREFADFFRCVMIKDTREWKEEIVWWEDAPANPSVFASLLLGKLHSRLAAAFLARLQQWIFGEPAFAAVSVPAEHACSLRSCLRAIVLSPEYSRSSTRGGFPLRRLDAEVLDDAIVSIAGTERSFSSIAPEPFTFLPPNRKSVLIEDGSITSAFLLLFGRPPRDTGRMDERDNRVTAKQRLYLFNSGKLHQALSRWINDKQFRKQKWGEMVESLYWSILSRAPAADEMDLLLSKWKSIPSGRAKWRFPNDIAWCLVNTREFLYRI